MTLILALVLKSVLLRISGVWNVKIGGFKCYCTIKVLLEYRPGVMYISTKCKFLIHVYKMVGFKRNGPLTNFNQTILQTVTLYSVHINGNYI